MRWLYLHGFASGPGSSKGRYFRQQFAEQGRTLELLDLTEGDFEFATVTRQLAYVRKEIGDSRVTLLGSSLGGWMAALLAVDNPLVDRLVLLAPAFGFPELWPAGLGEAAVQRWRSTGKLPLYHYSAGQQRLLDYSFALDAHQYPNYPDVQQPTLLLHGTRDPVVPLAVSQEFQRRHPQAELHLLNSGHELTDVLPEMWPLVWEFCQRPSAE